MTNIKKETLEELKAVWNAKADEFNQWPALSDEEKIEFASLTATRCSAATAMGLAARSTLQRIVRFRRRPMFSGG